MTIPGPVFSSHNPVIYPLSREIASLVSTLQPGAVATPDIDAAMTLLHLDRGDIVAEPKRFTMLTDVTFGQGECTPFSPPSADLFGYAQKRSILAFNLPRSVCVWHLVCPRLEETIRGVHMLDPVAFTLLLDIKITGEPGTHQRLLRTVPMGNLLEGVEGDLPLGPWPSNYTAPVAAHTGTVLHYDLPNRAMRAYSAALAPADHPLCGLFDEHRERVRLPVEIAIHPTLPLAVLIDRNPLRNEHHALLLASWHPDKSGILPLPPFARPGLYLSHAEFSPDGRWLVFRDNTGDSYQPEFMAVPVRHDAPPFFGPPLRLGPLHAGPPLSTCWCSGPQRFVATDGACIYAWEL